MNQNGYNLYFRNGKKQHFTDPYEIVEYLNKNPKFYISKNFNYVCKRCGRCVSQANRNKPCIINAYVRWDPDARKAIYEYSVEPHHKFRAESCVLRDVDTNAIILTHELSKLTPKKYAESWKWCSDAWWNSWTYKNRFLKLTGSDQWGYHRSIRTTNERKQVDMANIDGYNIQVRGKRSKRQLPNSWDDPRNSSYDYKGWKNVKVHKQWMVKELFM